MLLLGYPPASAPTNGRWSTKSPSGVAFSFGHLVVAQVQWLFTGHAPVVDLLPQLVVLQGGFVVHRQPLDGICGKSLEERR